MVRGNHISKKFWTPYIGEELLLSCEERNIYDKHAVAVRTKADAVAVGNAPREMSHVFWFFLQHRDVEAFLHLSRSFTCNSFHMTATSSLAHAFDT